MVDEDLEPLITRCPNCATQFRVTENQLAAAGGRVRCGACLTVFQGIDHLILDEASTFASGSEADAALDALLDELNFGDSATAAGADDDQPAEEIEPLLEALEPDGTVEPARQLYGGYEDVAADDAEQADAAAVAEQDEVPERSEGDGTEPAGADLPEQALGAATEEQAPDDSAAAADVPAAAPQDVSWPEEDYRKWIVPGTAGIDHLVDEIVASGQPGTAPAEQSSATGREVAAAPGTAEPAAGFRLSAVESALEEQGVGVRPISFAPEPRRWWVAGVALALVLLLAGQLFYLQLPDWSRDPDLRGAYEGFCGIFGCELPELRSVAAFRTRNLVVRSHPDLQDALVIDAVIVNEAGFAQRFPELSLRFTSVGGVLVAGRSFTPSEYLAGEMSRGELMPPDTPVQISLEIVDPGKEAVNYTLSFR